MIFLLLVKINFTYKTMDYNLVIFADNNFDLSNKSKWFCLDNKNEYTNISIMNDKINIIISKDDKKNENLLTFKDLNMCFDYLKSKKDIGYVNIYYTKEMFDKIMDTNNIMFLRKIILIQKVLNKFDDERILKYIEKNCRLCFENVKDEKYIIKHYEYVNHEEEQYLNISKYILDNGNIRETRNAKTISSFGKSIEFDLSNGFPLLTTKKMFSRGIFEELLFFLRGETNTKILTDKKVNIWKGNTSKEFIENNKKKLEEFDMGPMYGFQWRHYNAKYEGINNYDNKGIDQLKNVIDLLVNEPFSRRILMTTYNPEQVNEGVLYPCHGLILQFYVSNNKISLQMYQRSADWALGVPFNIASYGALLHIIVNLVNNIGNKNYNVGKIILVFGDIHIYSDDKGNHIDGMKEQINRKTYPFCNFELQKDLKCLDDLKNLDVKDLKITNYISHSKIKMDMIA